MRFSCKLLFFLSLGVAAATMGTPAWTEEIEDDAPKPAPTPSASASPAAAPSASVTAHPVRKSKSATTAETPPVLADGPQTADDEDVDPEDHLKLGDRYALVIGVAEYQDPKDNLNAAARDAAALSQFLDGFTAGKYTITTLTNQKATRNAIYSAVEKLKAEAADNDTVLFFFSGHGAKGKNGVTYLVPHDGNRDSVERTCVSLQDVLDTFSECRARQKLILMDACHSGASTEKMFARAKSFDSPDGVVDAERLKELMKGKGTVIMSSSQGNERSWEDTAPGGSMLGFFTKYLIKGLEGEADAHWGKGKGNGDGIVSVQELNNFVQYMANDEVKRLIGPTQKTRLLTEGTGDIHLAFSKPKDKESFLKSPFTGSDASAAGPLSGAAPGGPAIAPSVPPQTGPAGATPVVAAQLSRELQHASAAAAMAVSPVTPERTPVAPPVMPPSAPPAAAEAPTIPGYTMMLKNDSGFFEYKCEQDGATMVLVPAGEFWMGAEGGNDDAKPKHRVMLDAYLIDKLEVSNHQFAKFIADTGYKTAAERQGDALLFVKNRFALTKGASWRRPQGPGAEESNATHPVVCVTPADADAYARWAGKRLPTEAEWEKAARGDDMRHFPWGNEVPENIVKANCADSRAAERGIEDATISLDDGFAFVAPVGRFPTDKSPYGVMDMAGNVAEWCADWYKPDFYYDSPASNPTGATSSEKRSCRGGSWCLAMEYMFIWHRGSDKAVNKRNSTGFRCVRPVK